MIFEKYEFKESIYDISKIKMIIILTIISSVFTTIPFI